MQFVSVRALVALPVLVLEVDHVVLADAQTFDADVSVSIGDAARIDRVFIGISVPGGLSFDGFRQAGQSPVCAFEKWGKPASYFATSKFRASLMPASSTFLVFSSGLKGLPFSIPIERS